METKILPFRRKEKDKSPEVATGVTDAEMLASVKRIRDSVDRLNALMAEIRNRKDTI